jgi:phosphomannomutase
MNTDTLLRTAKTWADGDPDATTAAEVRALIAAKNVTELEDRFSTSLEFGTAGLRGVLGGARAVPQGHHARRRHPRGGHRP